MVVIMNLFVLMVVLSPFTAVIPGIYGIYILYKKKAEVLKNYLTVSLMLLFYAFSLVGWLMQAFYLYVALFYY